MVSNLTEQDESEDCEGCYSIGAGETDEDV
jgi:hypothetical protein